MILMNFLLYTLYVGKNHQYAQANVVKAMRNKNEDEI